MLSITESQKEKVWMGIGREDVDKRVIIALISQNKNKNKNRIIFWIREQNKTPINLSVDDIIVLTENDNIIIINEKI